MALSGPSDSESLQGLTASAPHRFETGFSYGKRQPAIRQRDRAASDSRGSWGKPPFARGRLSPRTYEPAPPTESPLEARSESPVSPEPPGRATDPASAQDSPAAKFRGLGGAGR